MNAPALPELPIGYPVLWRDEVVATLYSHYPESERTPERDCLIELPSGDLEDATYSELQALRDREMPVPEPEIESETDLLLPVRETAKMTGGMRTVTIANHAGGVGKTSIALNAGYELAQAGLRVLLIDMDSQGSLTQWLGVKDAQVDETIFNVIEHDAPLPQPRHVWGLDLIPATRDIAVLESSTFLNPGAIMNMRSRIEDIRGRWDVVIFDSPPSLGALFGLSAVASDALLIPLPTNAKGVEAIDSLLGVVAKYRKFNPLIRPALVIPTMYGNRRKGDQAFLEKIQAAAQSQIEAPCADPIPDRPAVWQDAAAAGQPLGVFAPYSDATKDARAVAHAIAASLGIQMPGTEVEA
ncbi:ParA family protein [Deinococcus wulumuqiensis]|uniref:ParA family protein n=1 Tax=Deinococcus wulumuqiensis TaxID=980427 RepID=UPI00242C2A1C|nr:ParA family protein [Deinococcus wulumuqiensis]